MIDVDVSRITINVTASVLEALEAIDRGGVGVAIVTDRGRFHGIVTDGDIRRALIGGADLGTEVRPFVNDQPTTMSPGESRDAALELLQARGFTAVPVVAGETAVGVHTVRSALGRPRRPNVAVVMAGGRGTRLGAITEDFPKPMLPVAGRPILERILHHLVGCGFVRIALAVNFKAAVIENHFGDGSDFGCHIDYLRERGDRPLGTAGGLRALMRLPGALDHAVLVLNGDIVTHAPLDRAMDHHESTGAHVTVGVTEHSHQVPFGVIEAVGDRVVRIEEKPRVGWTVGAGVNILSPGAIDAIPDGYHDMTDVYDVALRAGHDVRLHHLDGDWIDVGRPNDLALARGES